MTETIYLTKSIKRILTDMVFGDKEKTALFLGDRVSPTEIYVTNTTGAFEGEFTSVSLENLFHYKEVIGVISFVNRILSEEGNLSSYLLLHAHSHPCREGQIVQPGYEAWSVDDVPPQYNNLRGQVISIRDKGGNLIHLALKSKSDGKGGDDIYMKMLAEEWRVSEYQFFVRPPKHIVGKPMTKEVAIDCYKYDPGIIGKIMTIPISDHLLTPRDLERTLLDANKLKIIETEQETNNLVLPYRR